MFWYNFLETIDRILAIMFTLCYSYQIFYILVPFIMKDPPHKPEKYHRYAVLIAARNEEKVIGQLLDSIAAQDYPAELLQVFVAADNCTDATADIARRKGAAVYERFSTTQIGKGYALDFLLNEIERDYGGVFDGYFVFDADNLLSGNYIRQMNRSFNDGNEIVTSYRNSKNYGDNWISAGYALWFIRESEYLNHARMLLGTSCAVSGTGFLFSRNVLNQCGGWKFFLLTEDIEFSIENITSGRKIGYCPDAVIYDEQPTSFRQSWRQRLRWAKGYLQVFRAYGRRLISGWFGANGLSCFDMTMVIMPAIVLSVAGIAVNTAVAVRAWIDGASFWYSIMPAAKMLGQTYLLLFALGGIAAVTQWKRINTSAVKKIFYTFTFPIFMLTYIPISFSALLTHVEWKPIQHSVNISIAELERRK